MSPLILFLVGGSGARFLRSLLYQLAAGLQLQDVDEIKIVIIDTDESNGNYKTALTLLTEYQKIYSRIKEDSTNFRENDKSKLFYHSVSLFDEQKKFVTPLDTQKRTLRNIVNYVNLTPEQKDFVNLMLTDEELNDDLSIGFQGRPNMGTIGLEAITPVIRSSQKLNNLMGDTPNLDAEGIKQAKFFMVSSMFGGMGASGMPMLVNKFSSDIYSNNPIGAMCFMPYFKILDGKGNNDSKFFPQRTFLAYEHYKQDFLNKLNSLYFLGKSFSNEKGVAYASGKDQQNNEAHYIEFLSTTSLIHFCQAVPNPFYPRELKAYALHAENSGESFNANCLGDPYTKVFEDYVKLVFIAKYFVDRFEKNFHTDELKEVPWVRFADFPSFSEQDKKLLSSFFKGLLKYDYHELYNYSGLRVMNSQRLPNNISDVFPHKRYEVYKPGLLSKKRKYDNWPEIEMQGINDANIRSRDHVPRLLAIFDKSFTNIYNSVFK